MQSCFLLVSKHGISPVWKEIHFEDKGALRFYFAHEEEWAGLEQLDGLQQISGTNNYYRVSFQMDSPLATFELTLDGDLFCQGIVFSLDDLKPSEVD